MNKNISLMALALLLSASLMPAHDAFDYLDSADDPSSAEQDPTLPPYNPDPAAVFVSPAPIVVNPTPVFVTPPVTIIEPAPAVILPVNPAPVVTNPIAAPIAIPAQPTLVVNAAPAPAVLPLVHAVLPALIAHQLRPAGEAPDAPVSSVQTAVTTTQDAVNSLVNLQNSFAQTSNTYQSLMNDINGAHAILDQRAQQQAQATDQVKNQVIQLVSQIQANQQDKQSLQNQLLTLTYTTQQEIDQLNAHISALNSQLASSQEALTLAQTGSAFQQVATKGFKNDLVYAQAQFISITAHRNRLFSALHNLLEKIKDDFYHLIHHPSTQHADKETLQQQLLHLTEQTQIEVDQLNTQIASLNEQLETVQQNLIDTNNYHTTALVACQTNELVTLNSVNQIQDEYAALAAERDVLVQSVKSLLDRLAQDNGSTLNEIQEFINNALVPAVK